MTKKFALALGCALAVALILFPLIGPRNIASAQTINEKIATVSKMLQEKQGEVSRLESGEKNVNGYAIFGNDTPPSFLTGDYLIDQIYDSSSRIKFLKEQTSFLQVYLDALRSHATVPTGPALIAEFRTVSPGGTVQVPIRLQKAENIGSMNFVLTYDPSVLKVKRVDKGSLLSNVMFIPNYKEPPVILFGFATKDGVSGSGPVAYIEFEAIGDEGSSSTLTLSEVAPKDTSGQTPSLSTQEGKVTIGKKSPGDFTGDGKLTEKDALAALQMSVKLRVEDLILDMDKDGKVTVDDARQILKQAVRRW